MHHVPSQPRPCCYSNKIFKSSKGRGFLSWFYSWIILINTIHFTESLHLSDKWNSNNFFLFLAKFGFQKTDPKDLSNTQGYIYGNISFVDPVDENLSHSLMLVVVDSEYFLEFYGNRTLSSEKACPAMFNKIDTIAFDYVCKQHGKEDFLRKIPCPKNELCIDEDNPKNIVPGYQFTYKVQDVQRPRFWYLSIVSCYREKGTCHWKSSADPSFTIAYDIWMVNGNPSVKGLNPFEHQFSFENHDVFEIHLAAFVVSIILFLMWLYAFSKQRSHIITKVCTASLCVELGSIFCNLIHISLFAYNGVGASWLGSIGRLLDQASQCIFMLLLLLIAKGLGITTDQLKWKSVTLSMWAAYTLLNVFLYIWNLVEIDIIISNTDEWQTWPGYATLIFRLIVMLWFIYELQQTYSMTNRNITFVQHFGAFFLVWFCYLPALAFITTQVSPLWRYKTIISISYAVNSLAYAVIIYLLWPAQSILYLVEGERPLPIYDLEITGLLEDMNETVLFNREELELENSPREEEDLSNRDTPVLNGKTKMEGSESNRYRKSLANGQAKGSSSLNGHLEFYDNEALDLAAEEEQEDRKKPGEK